MAADRRGQSRSRRHEQYSGPPDGKDVPPVSESLDPLLGMVDQRANDYDYIDLYAADEQTDPKLILKHIPASIPTKGGNSIRKFWLEFNDSAAILPDQRVTGGKDMVAYVRNFAALMNISDVKPLLQRPVPGLLPESTSTVPGAPKNVRIVRF